MISGQSLAPGTPAISLNGSAPPGEHPDGLPPVKPQSDYCQGCHPVHGRIVSGNEPLLGDPGGPGPSMS